MPPKIKREVLYRLRLKMDMPFVSNAAIENLYDGTLTKALVTLSVVWEHAKRDLREIFFGHRL